MPSSSRHMGLARVIYGQEDAHGLLKISCRVIFSRFFRKHGPFCVGNVGCRRGVCYPWSSAGHRMPLLLWPRINQGLISRLEECGSKFGGRALMVVPLNCTNRSNANQDKNANVPSPPRRCFCGTFVSIVHLSSVFKSKQSCWLSSSLFE